MRGKDISVKTDKTEPIVDTKKDAKMIAKWLKKNKPSVQFKDEKMPHITPSGSLGEFTPTGFKI